MNHAIAFGQPQDWLPQDMQEAQEEKAKRKSGIFSVRRHFELALLISLLIHAAILSAVYIDEAMHDEQEFKALKIQLQEYGQDKEKLANLLKMARQESSPQIAAIEKQTEIVKANENENLLKVSDDKAEQLALPQAANLKSEQAQKAKEGNVLVAPNVTKSKNIAAKPALAAKPQPKPELEKKPLGNSNASDAEALMRYEQLLPLWLNRFRTYPPLARQLGLEGEGIVYLRINREGKVLYASIAKSTGHQLLDDALLSMVAAANPVIPVPADYSKGNDVFSYQIQFQFKLDEEYKIPVYQ